MKAILVIIALTTAMSSLAFEPVYIKTGDFKVKASRYFREQKPEQHCKFQTRFNERKGVIEVRIGVVGSAVSYFGWDMPIQLNEYPLQAGTKIYKIPGVTGMVMNYDGKTLTFEKMRGERVWNRIYEFSIEIDPELRNPGKFKGVLKGFDRGPLGGLRKHVQQTCHF